MKPGRGRARALILWWGQEGLRSEEDARRGKFISEFVNHVKVVKYVLRKD